MGKNVKYLLWWPRPWEYREAEAWLSEMAAKGWRLDSIGLVFAKFIKLEPANLRYRCFSSDIFAGKDSDILREYLDADRICIERRINLLVLLLDQGFSESIDRISQDKQDKYAQKRILFKIVLMVAFAIAYLAACIFYATNTTDYLNTTIQDEFNLILVSLCLFVYSLSSLFDLLYFCLNKNNLSQRPIRRWPGGVSRFCQIILLSLCVIFLMPGFRHFFSRSVTPVFAISDYINEVDSKSKVVGMATAQEGFGVLVPYRRFEFGSLETFEQNGNSNLRDGAVYSIAQYKTRSRQEAFSLGEKLRQHVYVFMRYFKIQEPMQPMPETKGFNNIWMIEDRQNRCMIVAVYGCDVYYVSFMGSLLSYDQLIQYLQQETGVASGFTN